MVAGGSRGRGGYQITNHDFILDTVTDHGYSLKYGLIIMNHSKIFGLITKHDLNFKAIMDHDSRVLSAIIPGGGYFLVNWTDYNRVTI